VEFGDFTLAVARLALHENLPDKRSDGLDGIRTANSPTSGRPRPPGAHELVLQRPRPQVCPAEPQPRDRIIGHFIIELANQSLV